MWRAKQSDNGKVVADMGMVFMLPPEFMAPENQEVYSDFDDLEFETMSATFIFTQQAVFDKRERYRHLKALYINGFVNGRPMSKMLVDGGAAVNIMPYATFRKLGKNDNDLLIIDLRLRDFGGNISETKGAINVELTVGSKTLLTTFFVTEGKGSYSLLLGRDWIHANCCIPSTMHQSLIQWHEDKVEIIKADSSVMVATVNQAY